MTSEPVPDNLLSLARSSQSSEVVVQAHSSASIAATAIVLGSGVLVLGPHAVIEDFGVVDLGRSGKGRLEIGSRSKLKVGVVVRCYNGVVSVGHRTTVGEYCIVYGHGGVEIGSDIGIGPHCVFAASQHIAYDREIPIRYQGETTRGIKIEDDVWLGAGVQVLDGATVARGGVIGAGSVVAQTTPANMVCVGIPCKPIRDRSNWSPL